MQGQSSAPVALTRTVTSHPSQPVPYWRLSPSLCSHLPKCRFAGFALAASEAASLSSLSLCPHLPKCRFAIDRPSRRACWLPPAHGRNCGVLYRVRRASFVCTLRATRLNLFLPLERSADCRAVRSVRARALQPKAMPEWWRRRRNQMARSARSSACITRMSGLMSRVPQSAFHTT